jgi:hypothetical protein
MGYDPQGGVPQEGRKPNRRFDPFQLFHRKQSAVEKLGRSGHSRLTFEKKDLPGAGAGQYAWETYGQPVTTWGTGNIYVTNPLRETFPAAYVFQAVPTVGIPPKGILQGQFTTQPLMDPNQAMALGVVAPGSVATGPNAIVNGAPILGP